MVARLGFREGCQGLCEQRIEVILKMKKKSGKGGLVGGLGGGPG